MNSFIFKKSPRARSIRISVHPDGRVVVTSPKLIPNFLVERFVASKQDWIDAKLAHFAAHPVHPLPGITPGKRLTRKDYIARKDDALSLVLTRLEHFNRFYNFEYRNVSIRNQKTRWGSCSGKQNLNFNYKIVYLNPDQQDYIIVHELCHLAQMNHGPTFWALVAKQIPEYKIIRASVRKFRL